jgi:hypothetical protein
MTRIEHPFTKVCRVVLKEKHPNKESAIPDGSLLAAGSIPEDVITEANDLIRKRGSYPGVCSWVLHYHFMAYQQPQPRRKVWRF